MVSTITNTEFATLLRRVGLPRQLNGCLGGCQEVNFDACFAYCLKKVWRYLVARTLSVSCFFLSALDLQGSGAAPIRMRGRWDG